MFVEVEEGGHDRDKESVKVYLIRFIADLPQNRPIPVTGVWYNFSIPNFFQVPGLYRQLFQNTWRTRKMVPITGRASSLLEIF